MVVESQGSPGEPPLTVDVTPVDANLPAVRLQVTSQRTFGTNGFIQNQRKNSAKKLVCQFLVADPRPEKNANCSNGDGTSDLNCMMSNLTFREKSPLKITFLPNSAKRGTVGGQLNSTRNFKPVVRSGSVEDDNDETEEEKDEADENVQVQERGPMKGGHFPQKKIHPYGPSNPSSPSSSSESSQGSSPGSSPRRDTTLPQTIHTRSSSLSGSTCSIYRRDSQTEGASGSSSSSSSPSKVSELLCKPMLHLAGGGLVLSATAEAPSSSASIVMEPLMHMSTSVTISPPVYNFLTPAVSVTSPPNSGSTETLCITSPFSTIREFPEASPLSWYSSASPATTDDSWSNSPQEPHILSADESLSVLLPDVSINSPEPAPSTHLSNSLSISRSVEGDVGFNREGNIPRSTSDPRVELLGASCHLDSAHNTSDNLKPLINIYLKNEFDEWDFDDLNLSDLNASAADTVKPKQLPPQVAELHPIALSSYPLVSQLQPGKQLNRISVSEQALKPASKNPAGSTHRTPPRYRPIRPKPSEIPGTISPPYQEPERGASVPRLSVVYYTGMPTSISTSSGTEQLLSRMTAIKKLEAEKRVMSGEIDLFKQDDDGDTNLHISVANGSLETTFAIVERMMHLAKAHNRATDQRSPIDIANAQGQTPLFVAVTSNNLILVRYLLERGANASLQCKDCTSPLHVVAKHGRDYLEVGQALCQARGVCLNQRNRKGFTPLHCAVEHENVEESIPIIQMLLKFGADLNFEDPCNLKTALHMAVERGSLELVKAICESDINIAKNINYRSRLGTALHFAALLNISEAEQLEIAEVLLKHGADRSLKNERDHKCPKDLVDKRRTKVRELLSKKR